MRICIGLILLLVSVVLPSQANAVCHAPQIVHRQNLVVQKILTPAYVIPQYSTIVQQVKPEAYWSVGAQYQEEAQAERISRLVLQKLKKKIQAGNLNTGSQVQPVQPEKPLGLSVLQTNCIKCHKPTSKAVVEGKAPKLFDENGSLTVSQQEIGSILTVVKKGLMPPQPAEILTDEEYLAIKVYLDSGKPPVTQPQAQPQSPQPGA